ncbi:MAG: hypothetical protein ACKOPP_04950 [Bacteroidota bacterium]
MSKMHMSTPPFELDGPDGPIKARTDFRVPDGYFDTLPQRVLAAIEEEALAKEVQNSRPGAWVSVWGGLSVGQGWALAASVVLVAGWLGIWRPWSGTKPKLDDAMLAQLTTSEISESLDLHIWSTGLVTEGTDDGVWGEPAWIRAEDIAGMDSLDIERSIVNWDEVETAEL